MKEKETKVPYVWEGKESDANILTLNLPVDDSAEYRLVWNDEFEGGSLDLSKWSADSSGCWNEDYAYTHDYPYWQFGDSVGTLSMTKMEEPDENGKRYLDAHSFITRDTMNFQYGYLEMRAKVPFYGKGEFPAFWLLSSPAELARRSPHYEAKPVRIEIDIFENFSSTNSLVANLHKYENVEKGRHSQLSGVDQGASKSGTKAYIFPEGVDPNDWHTYGMLWTEHLISFSVDGEFFFTYDLSKDFGAVEGMDCFHQPVSIIISNQIFSEGWCRVNEWAATLGPAQDEIFPLNYSVDYVRLYQKPGAGCLFTEMRNDRTSPMAHNDGRIF